jgi:carboxylate-amine ligase
MIEINSEVSENVKQCREFLNTRMSQLNDMVESQGLQLTATGTHPFQYWPERLVSNSKRYQHLHKKFQWIFRRMNVYGMHVHVGVPTGDRAIGICRAMIRYLPLLLALSANSPFWQGIDTGMQSCRVNIMDSFPLGGLPIDISTWQQFEHYYDSLYKVGAIKSFKDLYWYVRPNVKYGTIEIRVCDAMSTLNESMALVALIQCLVAKINEDLDAGDPINWSKEHHWIAPENQWIAARDGLDGMIIANLEGKRQKISDMVLELIPVLLPIAERLDCREELYYLSHIIKNGNGAQRQRKIFNETGSLVDVVKVMHEEFKSSFQECYTSSKLS